MKNITLLIATTDDKFLERGLNVDVPCVVVNQLIRKEQSDYDRANVFSYKEKGLSKSRNRAIEKATNADICLICDDDVQYKQNVDKIITQAFTENPDADIITFQIETPNNQKYKNYREQKFKHNKRSVLQVSSVEITFRRQSILEKKLLFDERFGLGTNFPSGEEAIFLSDALKKGLNIIYLPMPIAIHPRESSGKDYENPKLAPAKGALFYRIFGWKSYLLIPLFALKHYKETPYSIFRFIKLMFEGTMLVKN
ncbi:MAG: glycosyltransferase family 2 protein [Flavobacteriaceae bacterium]|nr:glycosyltransferase family 2 protein [Flavobacteriaceae bacterium]